MTVTEWRKTDEREGVEKGTSRNRQCDVSDTSSFLPSRFFRWFNCCRDAFSSLKWYYTCSWKRGGQFTCGVTDAVMKRENERRERDITVFRWLPQIARASSHPRAIPRSVDDDGTYSRTESRLFDRFNYTRGPGTRKPRAN